MLFPIQTAYYQQLVVLVACHRYYILKMQSINCIEYSNNLFNHHFFDFCFISGIAFEGFGAFYVFEVVLVFEAEGYFVFFASFNFFSSACFTASAFCFYSFFLYSSFFCSYAKRAYSSFCFLFSIDFKTFSGAIEFLQLTPEWSS